MSRKCLLEICCADADSVTAAIEGGADRIELCSALSEGGLTPSIGLIEHATGHNDITVNVLIRPRNGDFIYSPAETGIMIRDIEMSAKAGASGAVIGALTPDGNIDMPTCRLLINAAKRTGMTVTFHRAFDLCRNPEEALRNLIELDCDRLLTSGQAASALDGAVLIKALNDIGGNRIKIMAGAGVTAENAAEILKATGVEELHASAKITVQSNMIFRNKSVAMGSPDADEYSRISTSKEIVSRLADIVHNFS